MYGACSERLCLPALVAGSFIGCVLHRLLHLGSVALSVDGWLIDMGLPARLLNGPGQWPDSGCSELFPNTEEVHCE